MAAASNLPTSSLPPYTTIPGLVAVYFPGKRDSEYSFRHREFCLKSTLLFENITRAKEMAESIRKYNEAGSEYKRWAEIAKSEIGRLLVAKPFDRGYHFDEHPPIGIKCDEEEIEEGVLACDLQNPQVLETVFEQRIDLVNHLATHIIQSAKTKEPHNIRVCKTLREFAQMIVGTPLRK